MEGQKNYPREIPRVSEIKVKIQARRAKKIKRAGREPKWHLSDFDAAMHQHSIFRRVEYFLGLGDEIKSHMKLEGFEEHIGAKNALILSQVIDLLGQLSSDGDALWKLAPIVVKEKESDVIAN